MVILPWASSATNLNGGMKGRQILILTFLLQAMYLRMRQITCLTHVQITTVNIIALPQIEVQELAWYLGELYTLDHACII